MARNYGHGQLREKGYKVMADTNITIPELGSLTAGQVSDLLLVTRGTTGYKMLVSDIAKTIIETYQGSSLAGSAQSVKAALDSLNSRTTRKIISTYTASSDVSNVEVELSQIGNLIIGYVIFRANVTMEGTGAVIVSDLPTGAGTQFIGVCVAGKDAGKTSRFSYRGNSIQTYYTIIPPKADDTWLLQVIGFLA